eukprot:gene17836-19619_t
MGCSASMHDKKTKKDTSKNGPAVKKTIFPLSMYQMSLLKYSWEEIKKIAPVFGSRVFYRLLKEHPEMQPLFPEFSYLHNVEELKHLDRLTGHPKKLVVTIDDAIAALDDADVFIQYLNELGEKHAANSLKPEYLNSLPELLKTLRIVLQIHEYYTRAGALGLAFLDSVRDMLGESEYSEDVKKAWSDFYNFICKLMKQGLLKRLAEEDAIH